MIDGVFVPILTIVFALWWSIWFIKRFITALSSPADEALTTFEQAILERFREEQRNK